MRRLIVLLVLISVIPISGCINQTTNTGSKETTTTTATMKTTTTTENVSIVLLDAYCNQNVIYYMIKNNGNDDISYLTLYVDNAQKNMNCYPILPIKPGQTASCTNLATIGTHELRIVGPSNAAVGTVECKPIDTTIGLLDAYCNSTTGTLYISIKNKGTTIISFSNIRFYVDGKTANPNPQCKTPNALDTGNSITCTILASAGNHDIRIVGPSNAIPGSISC